MNKADVTKTRDKILEALLPHIPFDGWTWDAVQAGAKEAGLANDIPRAVFQGGMIDVLDAFADLADRKMFEALKDQNPEELRIRDRVRTALLVRYAFLAPHKEALRQSLSFWAFPTRKLQAAKIVWRTADRIWDWAGDTATDYNRYTKRSLLSGVIVSSTLAWVNDTSEELSGLESFIDRRIENVMQLGKIIGRFKPKTGRAV